jgi:dephospho-CoA kinase
MLKVGLTGGLGCGKTFVAAELERLGCHVIHADLLGHEVLARESGAVVALLGPSILTDGGQIDRASLASIVFEDPAKLAALNAIVHPAVRRREDEILSAMAYLDPHAIGVVEAAILIENGSYRDYDRLIVVWCEPAIQLERAMARDPAVVARLASQMPVLEKRQYADFLIDTNGTKEDTLRQTREVFLSLATIEKGI